MPHIGVTELGLVLLIVMFVFGVGKLPEVGGAIGKGIRDFRNSVSESDAPAKPAAAMNQDDGKAG